MSDSSPFTWPLAVSTFTVWDKLCISAWLLTNDRYTMGRKVEEFEEAFSRFSGMHALGLSSGSAANQLVFELWKIKHPGVKALVIVPAVTWISSISPAIMAGMDIAFCDVNLVDFSFDYVAMNRLLEANAGRHIIIWPTALIGFSPDMSLIRGLAIVRENVEVFLDSCENTFARLDGQSVLASAPITTTSCYFSHQVTAVEFGFAFFQDRSDYDLARMFRNHGMSRSLPVGHLLRKTAEDTHPDIDPSFLFAVMGTNLRPTDVHAVFGLRDFKRVGSARNHRDRIYRLFHEKLDPSLYYLPPLSRTHVGFCLPIFTERGNLREIKAGLNARGVETRPIIGGNLLRQPVFQQYGRPQDFPNAEWIHQHGCYVGLHQDVTEQMVVDLTNLLNAFGADQA